MHAVRRRIQTSRALSLSASPCVSRFLCCVCFNLSPSISLLCVASTGRESFPARLSPAEHAYPAMSEQERRGRWPHGASPQASPGGESAAAAIGCDKPGGAAPAPAPAPALGLLEAPSNTLMRCCASSICVAEPRTRTILSSLRMSICAPLSCCSCRMVAPPLPMMSATCV